MTMKMRNQCKKVNKLFSIISFHGLILVLAAYVFSLIVIIIGSISDVNQKFPVDI